MALLFKISIKNFTQIPRSFFESIPSVEKTLINTVVRECSVDHGRKSTENKVLVFFSTKSQIPAGGDKYKVLNCLKLENTSPSSNAAVKHLMVLLKI